MLLRSARSAYQEEAGQARYVIGQLKVVEAEVKELQHNIEDLTQIAGLLNTFADEQQAVVQGQIEGIVSKGLQTIFAEDMHLRLVNRTVGRRSEIDFLLVSTIDGEVLETSILDSRGGGVAAVAGFLIQAVLVLLTPGLRKVLFLDEVFAQVSEGYLEPLAEFIAELVNRSALQVVLVTHSPVFAESADRSFRFSQHAGVTTVERVR